MTLECYAYEASNYTDTAPIANVTWTQGGFFLGVTQGNEINVTSDTPGEINFTCTVRDDFGRNATAVNVVEFLAVNDTEGDNDISVLCLKPVMTILKEV